MQHNIFAWTEPTPPSGTPDYVSINRYGDGRHAITARRHGVTVTVEMPVEQFESMLASLAADLYRDTPQSTAAEVVPHDPQNGPW